MSPPTEVLVGQSFNQLTVIWPARRSERDEKCWLCRCSCGTEKIVPQWKLLRGDVKSCGCLPRGSPASQESLVGKRFTRLVVTATAPRSKRGEKCWLCRCDCEVEKVVRQSKLKIGKAKSCGCLAREHQAAWGQSQSLKFAQARGEQEQPQAQPIGQHQQRPEPVYATLIQGINRSVSDMIRELYETGFSLAELEGIFGIPGDEIEPILAGKTWEL